MSSMQHADRLLLLTWKRVVLILIAWILCVILHNLTYALFRPVFGPDGDEPVFFLLAVVVIPLYATACGVYSLVRLALRFAAPSRSR